MRLDFIKVDGTKVEDYARYILDYINDPKHTDFGTEYKIFVGCDSMPPKMGVGSTYVTAICIYKIGRGAHIIFARERKVKIYGNNKRERLKNRLWGEVYRAVEVADKLVEGGVMEHERVREFEIHLDVNPKENFESNVIHKEAIGYVSALGFDAYAKPDSPAASFASDRCVRGKERVGAEIEV